MILLLVMSDGRADYLEQAMTSASECLSGGPLSRVVIHDDSGDDRYRATLRREHRDAEIIGTGSRVGFSAAMNRAWRYVLRQPEEWVFHLEQDFVFERLVDLTAMRNVLGMRPHIRQMALRRQAWNDAERAAGGVIEQNPDAYRPESDGLHNQWMTHREFWTCNPSLYRREITRLGWPSGTDSERRFGRLVMRDPTARMAYWGSRGDPPWVRHIGDERAGWGY